MVFYIDRSCLGALEKNSEDAILGLNLIAQARKKGTHFIIAEREVLEHLSKIENEYGAIFYKLYSSGFNLKSIMNNVSVYAKIVFDGTEVCSKVYENGKTAIIIPLQLIIHSEIIESIILLGENLDDCAFYKIIAAYYMQKNEIQNATSTYALENGGGSTTGKVFENICKNRKRLCLCIADSDKKYYNCPSGETLTRIESVYKAREYPLTHIKPLFVHEVENLIPHKILVELTKGYPDISDGVKFLEILNKYANEKEADDVPMLYYDFKKGLLWKHFKQDCSNLMMKNYWTSVLNKLGIKPENEVYTDDGECVTPCICEKVLIHTINHINKKNNLVDMVDIYISKLWDDLGNTIFSWGCSAIPYVS